MVPCFSPLLLIMRTPAAWNMPFIWLGVAVVAKSTSCGLTPLSRSRTAPPAMRSSCFSLTNSSGRQRTVSLPRAARAPGRSAGLCALVGTAGVPEPGVVTGKSGGRGPQTPRDVPGGDVRGGDVQFSFAGPGEPRSSPCLAVARVSVSYHRGRREQAVLPRGLRTLEMRRDQDRPLRAPQSRQLAHA